MFFPDGMVKAGLFKDNVYIASLSSFDQLMDWLEAHYGQEVPLDFEEELRNYLTRYPDIEVHDVDVGRQLKKAEPIEDVTLANALAQQQEVSQAPWVNSGLTKEEYITKLQQIEEAEKETEEELPRLPTPPR